MQDWQRTTRFLWFVQFLTTLAMNLGLTFIPFVLRDDPVLAIADESTRVVYVSLILGAPFLTTIIFTPLWGWVADRTGPRRQVIRACFGLGLTQLLMAVAQTADQMVVIRMIQGMVAGVLAACLGLVASLTPPTHLGRAISLVQSATPAGQIIGPLAGGLLAVSLGFRATYALLGLLIVFTGLLTFWFLPRHQHVSGVSANPFVGLYQSARQALQQSALQAAFLLLVAGQFAFTVTQGVFAVYVAKIIVASTTLPEMLSGWWSSDIGFVAIALAITALANAVCAPWWGRLHDLGIPRLTAMGAGLLAVAMALLVVWPTWWAVLISRVGVGMGLGALATVPFAIVSGNTPREHRGQMMGLATAVTQTGNLLGFLLGGVLAAWWSEMGNFALAAGIYGLIVVVSLCREPPSALSRTAPMISS